MNFFEWHVLFRKGSKRDEGVGKKFTSMHSLAVFVLCLFFHALCFNQRVYKICLWLNDMKVTFFIRINLFKNTIKMQFIYSMCALNSSFNVKIILAGFKIQNVLMYYLKKKKLN